MADYVLPTLPNNGLARNAGIAEGLAKGVDAFFNRQNQMQEMALKERMSDIQQYQANAQGIEAASKLADIYGTAEAAPILQAKGLIPQSSSAPSGLLPPDQNAPARASPGATNPNVGANPNSPNANAPSGPDLDETPSAQKPQSEIDSVRTQAGLMPNKPGGLLTQSPQTAQTPTKGLPSMDEFLANPKSFPKTTRDIMMSQYSKQIEQSAPAYQAGLKKTGVETSNAENAPLEYWEGKSEKAQDDARKFTSAYTGIKAALNENSTRSPVAIKTMFPQLMNPDSNRPQDILDTFQGTANAKEELADTLQGRFTKKGYSPDTIEALHNLADQQYQNRASNYRSYVQDTEAKAKAGGVPPNQIGFARVSAMNAADKLVGSRGSDSPGGGPTRLTGTSSKPAASFNEAQLEKYAKDNNISQDEAQRFLTSQGMKYAE